MKSRKTFMIFNFQKTTIKLNLALEDSPYDFTFLVPFLLRNKSDFQRYETFYHPKIFQ